MRKLAESNEESLEAEALASACLIQTGKKMENHGREKTPVKLKGMGNGLCVTLDPAEPMDYLKQELDKLFGELRHLAVNARIVIDVGDRTGYGHVIGELGDFLKKSYAVGTVSQPLRKNPESPETRRKDMKRSWDQHRSDVLMLRGRVRSGQKITARKHLLILGDVNPGAEIVAGGDVIILGSLRGTAAAGQPGDNDGIILAIDFRPTQIQIGNFMAAGLPTSANTVIEFAHVENGSIVVEEYLAADPFGRIPWPQVR